MPWGSPAKPDALEFLVSPTALGPLAAALGVLPSSACALSSDLDLLGMIQDRGRVKEKDDL